tara:strand:- start:77 stop:631 length:555 start_codon:yes stop_codon:yes gene_type:complete
MSRIAKPISAEESVRRKKEKLKAEERSVKKFQLDRNADLDEDRTAFGSLDEYFNFVSENYAVSDQVQTMVSKLNEGEDELEGWAKQKYAGVGFMNQQTLQYELMVLHRWRHDVAGEDVYHLRNYLKTIINNLQKIERESRNTTYGYIAGQISSFMNSLGYAMRFLGDSFYEDDDYALQPMKLKF